MDAILQQIQKAVYNQCALGISDFRLEAESQDYAAIRFKLNGLQVLCRTAKITPNLRSM
jgi:hypothetical protein